MFLVTTVQVVRSTFADSIVSVADNSTDPSLDPEQFLLKSKILGSVVGDFGPNPMIGWGGALFISPKKTSGVSISISDSVFSRCQVVATAGHNSTFFGTLLQGGAVAAFLPAINRSSAMDPGYFFSITSTSFKQCAASFTSTLLPRVSAEVVSGGAISAYDVGPLTKPDDSFVLPRSRVVLQGVVFSGTIAWLLLFCCCCCCCRFFCSCCSVLVVLFSFHH